MPARRAPCARASHSLSFGDCRLAHRSEARPHRLTHSGGRRLGRARRRTPEDLALDASRPPPFAHPPACRHRQGADNAARRLRRVRSPRRRARAAALSLRQRRLGGGPRRIAAPRDARAAWPAGRRQGHFRHRPLADHLWLANLRRPKAEGRCSNRQPLARNRREPAREDDDDRVRLPAPDADA